MGDYLRYCGWFCWQLTDKIVPRLPVLYRNEPGVWCGRSNTQNVSLLLPCNAFLGVGGKTRHDGNFALSLAYSKCTRLDTF